LQVAGAIVDHDKIVPRPVHLGESQHIDWLTQRRDDAKRTGEPFIFRSS
jgi:hypothetical protein